MSPRDLRERSPAELRWPRDSNHQIRSEHNQSRRFTAPPGLRKCPRGHGTTAGEHARRGTRSAAAPQPACSAAFCCCGSSRASSHVPRHQDLDRRRRILICTCCTTQTTTGWFDGRQQCWQAGRVDRRSAMALQTSGSMPDLGRIPSALPVGRWFEWCQGPESLGGHRQTSSRPSLQEE